MILLINPIGDFPLNDDWSYGRTVRCLVEQNRLQFTGWMSMPLIAQVFWGAMFCLPFGFSFTALRFSTLSMGLIGIFATYALLRQAKANRPIAFFGSLLVAVNPLYFELSNTFMTDVPFFAITMLSFLLLIRGIHGRKIELLAGTLTACIAALIRQLGIVIGLSFAFAYLAKNRFTKKSILTALLPTVLIAATLIAYQVWLQSAHGLPAAYNAPTLRLLNSLKMPFGVMTAFFGMRAVATLMYLGLFLLPLLIMLIPYQWKSASRRERLCSVFALSAFAVAVMAVLMWKGRFMPLLGNILFDTGLGPATLRDVSILRLPHLPGAPKTLWLVITVVSIAGAAILLHNLFSTIVQLFHWRRKTEFVSDKWPIALVVSACALYFIPMGITWFFDRYLIFFLPLLMLIVLNVRNPVRLHISRWSVFIAAAILVFYGTFTLAATHDYLSWNRARWQALRYLTEEANISHRNIDGGFEFNGWYGYNPKYRPSRDKSWWWVNNDDYIISFGPITGYNEIKRYPYRQWLRPGQAGIFILHRLDKKNEPLIPDGII